MSQTSPLTPDHLFDGPWRPGHLLRQRHSRLRRWGMLALFLVFCSLIAGYIYITDADRVRGMAQSYLSALVGGRVEIDTATLSLFEGLRLDHVHVFVDETDGEPDALLFSADMILIKYDPRELVQGRLRAEQIIATEPHVHVSENLDTGKWNYQRLSRRRTTTQPATRSSLPRNLDIPEILLRSAQVDYSQIKDGEYHALGSLAVEGQLTPAADGRYLFEVQTRGAIEGAGAAITGSILPRVPQYNARIVGFEFGRDVLAMLPAEIWRFLQDHQIAGRINVPVLSYSPAGQDRAAAAFRAEIELDGVTMVVHPQEWMGQAELERREAVRQVYQTVARLSEPLRADVQPVRASSTAPAIAHQPAIYDHVLEMLRLEPIRLNRVSGRFVFTEKGVEINDLAGRIENNALVINGRLDGYSPQAPAWVRLQSATSEHVYIPPAPAYVKSMPRPVRQLYQHLKPQGLCDVVVEFTRATTGARPSVSGWVNVIDGQFVFDRFPYPVRNATGVIAFGPDQNTGYDTLEIKNLRGFGVEGGPNANAQITLSGTIAPLGNEAGAGLTIEGPNVTREPALDAAFPSEVRQTLAIFDPEDTGAYPQFHGSFVTRVEREVGRNKRWMITTDITLADAEGQLDVFPYPLKHVTGRLTIHNDFVEITDVAMTRGDATLSVNGRVSWKDIAPGAWTPGERYPTIIRPDIQIAAMGVPLDADLLGALPADQRQWIERLGLSGKLDVQGRVYRNGDVPDDAPLAKAITHEFDIAMREGSAWPAEGTFAVTDLAGRMRLLPDRLILTDITAKRGDADIAGLGTISWPDKRPHVAYQFNAKNLLLEPSLYRIIPEGARRAWDQVQPEGSVDVEIAYTGQPVAAPRTGEALADVTNEPTTKPASHLAVTITPRDLSATVKALPYRLDDVRGAVRVMNDAIELHDLTAKHGEATVRLSGTGSSASDGAWDLRLAADNVTIDDEFVTALPPALASLIESMKLTGTTSFAFSKLIVRGSFDSVRPATDAAVASTDPSLAVEDGPPLDLDFTVKIDVPHASADVGVPMTDLAGQVQLTGAVRDGSLHELNGAFAFPRLAIAGRPAQDLAAELSKAAGQETMHITSLRGQLADGEIAGDVELAIPEDGPSRYGLRLVLREADVRTITADTDHDISGRLTASLALEGAWSDPTSRRGRGDVSVRGREMYKVPVVLGLLKITNLSLPITSPFNDAAVSYAVDGERVTLEQITLRSSDMLMQGDGYIDFGTKAVRLSFTTDNPNWPQLPVIGPIVQGARHEILRIHVRGTLQEPKVSAAPVATFTTTVDEVLGGDGR